MSTPREPVPCSGCGTTTFAHKHGCSYLKALYEGFAPAEGLDFETARKAAGYPTGPTLGANPTEAFESALNAQHLAIVARVRAETRRETLIEVRAQMMGEQATEESHSATVLRMYGWLDSHLQVSS